MSLYSLEPALVRTENETGHKQVQLLSHAVQKTAALLIEAPA